MAKCLPQIRNDLHPFANHGIDEAIPSTSSFILQMRIRFLILFVLSLACASCNRARNPPQTEEPAPRIYLPVFGLTVGSDSRVEDFHLIKVIETLAAQSSFRRRFFRWPINRSWKRP